MDAWRRCGVGVSGKVPAQSHLIWVGHVNIETSNRASVTGEVVHERLGLRVPGGLRSATIHEGGCGFCKEGRGRSGRGTKASIGRWLGPTDSLDDARSLADLSALACASTGSPCGNRAGSRSSAGSEHDWSATPSGACTRSTCSVSSITPSRRRDRRGRRLRALASESDFQARWRGLRTGRAGARNIVRHPPKAGGVFSRHSRERGDRAPLQVRQASLGLGAQRLP